VIAVGTTVVRALETAAESAADGMGPRPGADATAVVAPAAGWTGLVITPRRGVRAVDGLITGFHEPRSSHLSLLCAVAGRDLVRRSYVQALAEGYHWHEFGDVALLLGTRRPDPDDGR
jgi:S-adenosylmethionine:tRNA ribosyltransferase-isomerase